MQEGNNVTDSTPRDDISKEDDSALELIPQKNKHSQRRAQEEEKVQMPQRHEYEDDPAKITSANGIDVTASP